MMEHKKIWLLLGILLVALALRLHHLDQENLWNDEAFSVHHAAQPELKQVLSGVATTEAAPIGYYALLHYWIKISGTSEFAVRLPSVLFAVAAIYIFYLLLTLFFEQNIVLLASLFMATSMLQVLFSQEARIYSLFTFLSLLTTYFFVRLFRQQELKYYLAYVISLALSLYVNYMAVFLAILYAGVLVWNWEETKTWRGRWSWLTIILLTVVGIHLLPLIQAQFDTLSNNLVAVLIGKGLPSFLAHLGLFFYALPLLMVSIVFLLLALVRQRIKPLLQQKFPDSLFLVFIFLYSAIYLYLVSTPLTLLHIPITRAPITNSYFLIRHSFFLVPLFYTYLSWRIFSLNSKQKKIVCILVILAINVLALAVYDVTPTKPEWRETVEFIQNNTIHSNTRSPPLVLMDKAGISNEFLFHYYYPANVTLMRLTWSEELRDARQVNETELLAALQKVPEFWLILSKNPKTGYYYRDLLDTHYQRDIHQEFYEIKVYHYKARK